MTNDFMTYDPVPKWIHEANQTAQLLQQMQAPVLRMNEMAIAQARLVEKMQMPQLPAAVMALAHGRMLDQAKLQASFGLANEMARAQAEIVNRLSVPELQTKAFQAAIAQGRLMDRVRIPDTQVLFNEMVAARERTMQQFRVPDWSAPFNAMMLAQSKMMEQFREPEYLTSVRAMAAAQQKIFDELRLSDTFTMFKQMNAQAQMMERLRQSFEVVISQKTRTIRCQAAFRKNSRPSNGSVRRNRFRVRSEHHVAFSFELLSYHAAASNLAEDLMLRVTRLLLQLSERDSNEDIVRAQAQVRAIHSATRERRARADELHPSRQKYLNLTEKRNARNELRSICRQFTFMDVVIVQDIFDRLEPLSEQ